MTYLVSDCTIVGGDSGGPLFDLEGKVVGIHSQIRKSLTKNLHVPIQAFKDDWQRMLRGDIIGVESSAVMGVELNWEGKKEPTLLSLVEGGPAATAGAMAGDRIVRFNGEAVSTSDDVEQIMSGCFPGQTITLELLRGEETIEVKLKLGRKSRNRESKE